MVSLIVVLFEFPNFYLCDSKVSVFQICQLVDAVLNGNIESSSLWIWGAIVDPVEWILLYRQLALSYCSFKSRAIFALAIKMLSWGFGWEMNLFGEIKQKSCWIMHVDTLLRGSIACTCEATYTVPIFNLHKTNCCSFIVAFGMEV